MNKVALLLYIEMINTWLAMPLKIAKKRNVIVCPISEVNQHIIDMYSVPSANGRWVSVDCINCEPKFEENLFYRMRPTIMKDKGLVHSLILALTVSNFVLDLEQFRVMLEIRTSLKKLTDLAKIIGAVSTKDDKKVIMLKVPMPPPKSLVKKGKKSAKSK